MNERLSRAVARWLSHPTGFLQGVLLTGSFFVPLIGGWKLMSALFYYLAFATFVSFQTQFTLAYQNRKKELRDELMLRNLVDTMRLLVAMSEKQEDQLDEIHDAADKAAAGAMARAATITARAAAAASLAYAKELELGVESDLPQKETVAREGA